VRRIEQNSTTRAAKKPVSKRTENPRAAAKNSAKLQQETQKLQLKSWKNSNNRTRNSYETPSPRNHLNFIIDL